MFGRWRRPSSAVEPAGNGVDLSTLLGSLLAQLPLLEKKAVSLEVVRAQLSDLLRDLGSRPPPELALSASDEEQARRLALSARIARNLSSLSQELKIAKADSRQLFIRLQRVSEERKLLSISLMRESDARLEEFTRAVVASLEVPIAGESAQASAEHLYRLDYQRLLEEAGLAKASAEERSAYLRKLQEKATPVRRGKF